MIIFYVIDDGRSKFLSISNSIDILLNLIDYLANNFEKSDDEKLIDVLFGCIHNITNENGEYSNSLALYQLKTETTLILEELRRSFNSKHIIRYLMKFLSYFNYKTIENDERINRKSFKNYMILIENLIELDEIKEEAINENFVKEFYLNLNIKLITSNDAFINETTSYYEDLFQFLDTLNNLSMLFEILKLIEIN